MLNKNKDNRKKDPIDISNEVNEDNVIKKNQYLNFLKKDTEAGDDLSAEIKKTKDKNEKKLLELTKQTRDSQKKVEEKMASILSIKEDL